MMGVREGVEGLPVELWRDATTGRLQVVAFNEAGYNSVEIDLCDLLAWLRGGPYEHTADSSFSVRIGTDPE